MEESSTISTTGELPCEQGICTKKESGDQKHCYITINDLMFTNIVGVMHYRSQINKVPTNIQSTFIQCV